jgi:hypothetical protein
MYTYRTLQGFKQRFLLETRERFFDNYQPEGEVGDYDKVVYHAHISKRTRYGQSINMQFGVGNQETSEQSFFSSLFLYLIHHFFIFHPNIQAIPQRHLLELMARDPLLIEMVGEDGLDKLRLGLDSDIGHINKFNKKKNCGMTLMNITTKVFVFEASIRMMKALIIREALI